MDPLRDLVLPALSQRGPVRPSGGSWSARCPAHEDHNPSLSVSVGKDHPVVFHCQAGCAPDAVLDALGLTWADLLKPREERRDDGEWTPAGPAVAVYDYRDEDGHLLFQVLRTAAKDFRQRVPDASQKSGWRWSLGDTRRVLYKLPKILTAVQECRMIYIVEGEKDVATLEHHGHVATCNPGGAGKWRPEYTEALRDAVVTIIADKDTPGQNHARQVRDALVPVAASVTIAEAGAGKDATDHFAAGLDIGDLEITFDSGVAREPILAVDLWDFLDASDPPPNWVIPGLLERGDRLILTGFEGLGKSMLVRQLAVCAAAGLHPFARGTDHHFDPVKVLYIDCENSEAQSRRKLRAIAIASKYYHRPVGQGLMRLIHRPEGVDLTTDDDQAWLYERVTAHKPDLLVIGPFYRLHNANMNDEQVARRVVSVLDRARSINDSALVTEAHAGHGEAGKSRSVRPTGSSLLLRWPEFGYGLAPNGMSEPDEFGRSREVDLIGWRGPRDDRDWPRHLKYGGLDDLPWKTWNPPPPLSKEKR